MQCNQKRFVIRDCNGDLFGNRKGYRTHKGAIRVAKSKDAALYCILMAAREEGYTGDLLFSVQTEWLMLKMPNADIVAYFLSWKNDFISVACFADHYGFNMQTASSVIYEGRKLHDAQCLAFKADKANRVADITL